MRGLAARPHAGECAFRTAHKSGLLQPAASLATFLIGKLGVGWLTAFALFLFSAASHMSKRPARFIP